MARSSGDHGAQGHAHTLFDELLRVPLIIKLPDSHASVHVSTRVSTERLAPTLLEAADVAFEAKEMSGPSLLALMRSGVDNGGVPPVVSETRIAIDNLQSVTSDEKKFVRSLITAHEQLYDLTSDPGETASQLASSAELGAAARKHLEQHEDPCRQPA